jgi:hypothetical protein
MSIYFAFIAYLNVVAEISGARQENGRRVGKQSLFAMGCEYQILVQAEILHVCNQD